jgi:hypothetical protein
MAGEGWFPRFFDGELAMKSRTVRRVGWVLAMIVVASMGLSALRTEAAGRKCPRGVHSCSAAQVGQPCNPNNLNIICSAQAGDSYCCLAYAP